MLCLPWHLLFAQLLSFVPLILALLSMLLPALLMLALL